MAGRGTDIKLGGNAAGHGLGEAARQISRTARGPPEDWKTTMEEIEQSEKLGEERRKRAGRPARHLHRAARLGPHRPPAHGPLRPPGRSRHRPPIHVARRRRPPHRLRPRNGRQDGAPRQASRRQRPEATSACSSGPSAKSSAATSATASSCSITKKNARKCKPKWARTRISTRRTRSQASWPVRPCKFDAYPAARYNAAERECDGRDDPALLFRPVDGRSSDWGGRGGARGIGAVAGAASVGTRHGRADRLAGHGGRVRRSCTSSRPAVAEEKGGSCCGTAARAARLAIGCFGWDWPRASDGKRFEKHARQSGPAVRRRRHSVLTPALLAQRGRDACCAKTASCGCGSAAATLGKGGLHTLHESTSARRHSVGRAVAGAAGKRLLPDGAQDRRRATRCGTATSAGGPG